MKTVAIIGAGIAGLSTGKLMLSLGYKVQIFEKEPDLGGVWAASRRYPGLATQNPRDTYAFSDFPMPADYPEWPSGKQVQAYLEAYADHFQLKGSLSLNTLVVDAKPTPQSDGWQVTTCPVGAPSDQTSSRTFDWLIICNGIFSIPSVPNYPGSDAFKDAGGSILHTSQFTRLDDVAGKNVIVVGYGKSSCDVANATVGVSAQTTLLARQLIWKIPKRIGNVLNFKHLFLTRMGEGLFPYLHIRGFERFLHGPGRPFRNGMLNLVQGIISRQLKLSRIDLEPDRPLESIARSTVSLVSDGFYERIANGQLFVSVDEIARLEPGLAILKSGRSVAADIIVCGTGWDQRASFLSAEVLAKITDADGNFLLYRSTLPIGFPRLAFNGYNSSFFSQLSAEVGSFWIAEYIAGRIAVPDDATQRQIVEERLAWMTERTDGKHCKGTNIVPFSLHHIDELLADVDLTLPWGVRVRQWFKAVNASEFGRLPGRIVARARGSNA